MANPNVTVKKFRRVHDVNRTEARKAESAKFGEKLEEAARKLASGEWSEDQVREFLK